MHYSALDVARTLLFVPGNRQRMLERAPSSGADVLVADLEDSVPAREKAEARAMVRGALPAMSSGNRPVFARVNHVGSGLTQADLRAVVRPGLAGIVHPKTDKPQDLRDLDVMLREAEVRNKVRPGDTAVVALIETAAGVLDLQRIALAIDRVAGLALGGEDYTAALGVPRSDEALAFARGMIVTVSAALGMAAIDTPYPAIDDGRGLAREAKLAAAMGFRGKFAIHPEQIAAVNKAFTPTAEDVNDARRIVEAARRAERQRKGSISLDGKMVDAPVVARAERVIALAERSA